MRATLGIGFFVILGSLMVGAVQPAAAVVGWIAVSLQSQVMATGHVILNGGADGMKGAATDPQGVQNGTHRVIRGGCWYFIAYYCRSAYRSAHSPDYIRDYIGFRAVLPLRIERHKAAY